MKRRSFLTVVLLCVFALSLCACVKNSGNNNDTAKKYSVTFITEEGEGTAPVVGDKKEGEVFSLPENTFIRDDYDFSGWVYSSIVYNAGDSFTMPSENVTFTAKWTPKAPVIGQPEFSQSLYNYDRFGGEDLELPLSLKGGNVYYVELNGETLYSDDYHYDEDSLCLVIKAEIILALGDGEFEVKVITDAPDADTATCIVKTDNSVKTSFDTVTTKQFRYGYENGVSFNVNFNGTTITSLKQGDFLIDKSHYEQTSEGITIKSSILKKSFKEATYTLLLSNNDKYSFTVKNNIIFYSDYDMVTIHDTSNSNTGLNSLYQYSDNVKIVDGIAGMDGKVLRFTPNTKDVLYDCHSIYTLRKSEFESTWYNVGYAKDKCYAFSFDYMTEGTSTGTFFFGSRDTSWKFDLLLGAENDGILHHFEAVATYEEIANGTWVRAFFKDAGGCIYFDNFTVVELDSKPTISVSEDYPLNGDYVLNCDLSDFDCDFYLDNVLVNEFVSVNGNKLTIKADALRNITVGEHTFAVKTDICSVQVKFSAVDNRACTIKDTTAKYDANKAEAVKIYGSFDQGVTLVSVKQIKKVYNGGYNDWDFAQCDTEKNYASLLNLVTGLNDKGYVEIPSSVADLFFGETQFEITFNTGKTERIILKSSIVMSSNYDDTSILGYHDNTYVQGSPMYSGMNGNSIIKIEERSTGNKALFVRSTENAEAKTLFSMKFMPHVWDWLYVSTNENNQYRVTFTYKISSNIGAKETYFYIMDRHDSNVANTFFGSGYEVVDVGGWNEIRWYLTADGEEHVFDTGWFTNTTASCDLPRLMQIRLPDFKESDNKFIMVDDLRVWETDDAEYFLTDVKEYVLGANGISFATKQNITKVKIDNEEFEFALNGEINYTVDKNKCNLLTAGTHELTVIGERGIYKTTFVVVDNRKAVLTEVSKKVIYGQETVFLKGEFDESLTVLSVKRKGALFWDNTGTNTAVQSDGTLPVSYVTLSKDGITLSKQLIDQVYGSMSYTIVLSNNKEITFTLTSNVMYYSNWDETYVQEETALETGSGNVASCQDTSMIEIVDVNGNKKYKYTPTNATLGHSQGGFTGGVNNGCLTFANSNFTSDWWNFNFASVETVIVFFDYEIVTTDGKTPNYEFIYRDNQYAYHTVAIDGTSGTFYTELDANTVERFYVHCAMTQKSDAEGTYMLIDNFGFGVKENVGQGKNKIYNSHYDVTDGMTELKVDGEFESGVTIASILRQAPRMNSAGSLDTAYLTPSAVDTSWIEIGVDGITLKQEILALVYGVTRFDITLSNNVTFSLVLKSNVLLFIDYDNISFFDNTSVDDSAPVIEWTQDKNMLEIIEEEGNKKLVYTPSDTVRGDAVSNGNNGAINFSHTGRNNYWYNIAYDTVGQITISFDYKIDLGEQTESYYSIFYYSVSEGGFKTAKIDANETHYSITFNAEDLVLFRIYCPVSDASLYEGTSMTIDNFKIVKN